MSFGHWSLAGLCTWEDSFFFSILNEPWTNWKNSVNEELAIFALNLVTEEDTLVILIKNQQKKSI